MIRSVESSGESLRKEAGVVLARMDLDGLVYLRAKTQTRLSRLSKRASLGMPVPSGLIESCSVRLTSIDDRINQRTGQLKIAAARTLKLGVRS